MAKGGCYCTPAGESLRLPPDRRHHLRDQRSGVWSPGHRFDPRLAVEGPRTKPGRRRQL